LIQNFKQYSIFVFLPTAASDISSCVIFYIPFHHLSFGLGVDNVSERKENCGFVWKNVYVCILANKICLEIYFCLATIEVPVKIWLE
jgi:hypothetical protein